MAVGWRCGSSWARLRNGAQVCAIRGAGYAYLASCMQCCAVVHDLNELLQVTDLRDNSVLIVFFFQYRNAETV
jgi:hypothetical protein